MKIDKQTLNDLEIFKTEDGEIAVFDLIDKTTTSGGRNKLREKLLNPLQNIALLLDQQETIRYLAEYPDKLILPFASRHMKALEEYVSSNINPVVDKSMLESVRFYLSDIQSYRFIKGSLPDLISFVTGFHGFLKVHKLENTRSFHKSFQELSGLISTGGFEKVAQLLSKHSFGFHKVLQADRWIRTQMKDTLHKLIDDYFELDALLGLAQATRTYNFHFPESGCL